MIKWAETQAERGQDVPDYVRAATCLWLLVGLFFA